MENKALIAKKGMCACGCGEYSGLRTHNSKRGELKGEPRKYKRGHATRLSRVPYEVDSNGCWIWRYGVSPNGYGHAHVPGSRRGENAHRHYYKKYKGHIPNGFVIDHLCRVPKCVNPEHLEAVLQVENVRRGKASKVTLEIVREIRKSIKEYEEELAKKYRITLSNISVIRRIKTWYER